MYRASCLHVFLLALASSAALAAKPQFEARDCSTDASAAGARCGVVYVPENHDKPRGRKIPIHVVVLPATGPHDGKRAQFDLEGGPGFAATDFLEFYAGEGAPYRQKRDIVLADMRGTGQSNPLRCPGLEKRQPALPLYPPELVAECAKQLSSYGTTLALRYMADFPKAVHAAVLMGTVPASRMPPRYHATAAQAALEQLMVDRAADSACRAMGDMRANLSAALQMVVAVMTAPVFLEKLRNQLYLPASRVHIPNLLVQAAQGDFRGFTGSAGSGRAFADGLYLSITCAESFAHMDVDAAIAVARATIFGAYRLERQRDACEHWPKGWSSGISTAAPHVTPTPPASQP